MRTLRGLAREVLGPWGGRAILALQFTEMVGRLRLVPAQRLVRLARHLCHLCLLAIASMQGMRWQARLAGQHGRHALVPPSTAVAKGLDALYPSAPAGPHAAGGGPGVHNCWRRSAHGPGARVLWRKG